MLDSIKRFAHSWQYRSTLVKIAMVSTVGGLLIASPLGNVFEPNLRASWGGIGAAVSVVSTGLILVRAFVMYE